MPENSDTDLESLVDRASPTRPSQLEMSPWSRVFWLLIVLIVAALLVYGGFIWISGRTIDSVESGMDNAKDTILGIADAFQPETISSTFVEFTELSAEGNEGNILEVAIAEATEKFTRTTNVVWFDQVMPLGKTVSEISVPATYRYHIDLNGDWSLAAYDKRITVIAPRLVPSLPVAFDSGKMKKKTRSGWGRWDGDENLEDLETSLTDELALRAASDETIAEVREEARVSVAKFVRQWLLTHQHWGDQTYEEIVVVFEEELEEGMEEGMEENLSDRSSTLRLEPRPSSPTPVTP